MVRYREIRPSARLQPFIQSFWILEHGGDDAAPQRVVPDGRPELIVNWGRPYESCQDGRWTGQPQAFLAGQLDSPLLLRPTGPAKMLGIRFHPHGAAAVLAQPVHELSGRFTPVQDLSPSLALGLDRALDVKNPIVAIEAALQPRQDRLAAAAVERIVAAKGALDIAALARDLGLSTRQLERRFQATVGLPPKLFCRIERFSHVFRVLGEPACNWVETAVTCGYYDQAHLIRDCKSFSGHTPAVLAAADADLARHFYLRFGVSHSSNTTVRAAV